MLPGLRHAVERKDKAAFDAMVEKYGAVLEQLKHSLTRIDKR